MKSLTAKASIILLAMKHGPDALVQILEEKGVAMKPKTAAPTGEIPIERFPEAQSLGAPLLKPMHAAEAALTARDETVEASEALAFVDTVTIDSAESFEAAVLMTAEIKAQRAKIDGARQSFVKPLNDVVKAINDFFRPAITAYDRAEALLKQRALAYQAEADRQREALLREAEERMQDGDVSAAETTIAVAATAVVPKVAGASTRIDWTGEVVDADAIPREYMIPDVAKLEAVTKALKKDPNIPGWRAFKKTGMAVRKAK